MDYSIKTNGLHVNHTKVYFLPKRVHQLFTMSIKYNNTKSTVPLVFLCEDWAEEAEEVQLASVLFALIN